MIVYLQHTHTPTHTHTHTLEPEYLQHVSVETARKWLLELGFTVMEHKKGTYVDGREILDVTEYRKKFLRRLCAVGFLYKGHTNI